MNASTSSIRLMIVDDHAILAESLKELINRQSHMSVSATANSGRKALRILEKDDVEIDIVLLDLSMEEEPHEPPAGIHTARKIITELNVGRPKRIKVIALTQILDGAVIDCMHRMHVHGYLLKDCPGEELIQAIEHVGRGGRYYRNTVEEEWNRYLDKPVEKLAPPKLTHVEQELLPLIAQGLTTKEIATIRGRTEDSIEAHRRNMMKKFEARNAPHMISLAYNYGFIKPY
ncbi:MAG: response regulator transcription factor [Bacteroidota bacterium]